MESDRLAWLGSNIKILRKKQGISQENLAHMSGVDRSHMGFIERGKQNPTILTLFQIADALGVLPGSLLKGVE
ncbi:MAG: helix-turn-helix transcriptional regulator [Pseudomonadales bacterium]